MIAEADLAADDDVFADDAGARDAGLRGNERVGADANVVGDVDEVVELDAGVEAGGRERAAVEGGVGADFDVVGNFDRAELREFKVLAFPGDVAETVRADHGAGVDQDAVAESHAGVERDAGIEATVRAESRAAAEETEGGDLRAFGDGDVVFDDGVRANGDAGGESRGGRDDGGGVNASGNRSGGEQPGGGFGEGELGMGRAKERFAGERKIGREKDTTRCGGGGAVEMARGVHVNEVGGAGGFGRGEAGDGDGGVAFEWGGEELGEVACGLVSGHGCLTGEEFKGLMEPQMNADEH